MPEMYKKDGPPLSLGKQLYWGTEPKVLRSFHGEILSSINTGTLYINLCEHH